MESPEVAPQLPEAQGRFKTMQTLHTPSGNTFEYCLDSDDNDCDVSSEIEMAGEAMNYFFDYCDKLFK